MKTRKCGLCHKPGHRADNCPERGADPKPKPEKRERPAGALVSAADLPKIKDALAGVIQALEQVPPQHRARVIRSAQIALGDE